MQNISSNFWWTEYSDGGTNSNSNSAPDREHVEDDGEDSDNFLVLLWLVQLVNLEVSLTTRIQWSGFVEIVKSSLM